MHSRSQPYVAGNIITHGRALGQRLVQAWKGEIVSLIEAVETWNLRDWVGVA
jgi:hypothetical protein